MPMSSIPTTPWLSAPVKVAQISDGQALIDSGLTANEQVVVDGQYKLQPGTHVRMLHGKAAQEAIAQSAEQATNPMNISAPFIERPIATALLMVDCSSAASSAIRYCRSRRCRMSIIRRSR